MKNTEYDRVSSADSESTLEGDEPEDVLLEKTPWRDASRQILTKRWIIILSTLNILLFIMSTVFFGTWVHDNYFVLNAHYRKVNAYCKLTSSRCSSPQPKLNSRKLTPP